MPDLHRRLRTKSRCPFHVRTGIRFNLHGSPARYPRVKAGTRYAWWFRKYSKDETLARLEAEARQAKRGLWADPKPIPPWEWRKEQRTAELPLSSLQLVPNGVEIAALLPNPAGRDEGHEQVVIRNATSTDVDLAGWSLRDRAGHVFWLTGKVPAGGTLTITMTEPTMPLNNDGDEVVLIDASGVARSRVAYAGEQARSGAWVGSARPRASRPASSQTQATVTARRANEHLFRCGTTSEFLQIAARGADCSDLAGAAHTPIETCLSLGCGAAPAWSSPLDWQRRRLSRPYRTPQTRAMPSHLQLPMAICKNSPVVPRRKSI